MLSPLIGTRVEIQNEYDSRMYTLLYKTSLKGTIVTQGGKRLDSTELFLSYYHSDDGNFVQVLLDKIFLADDCWYTTGQEIEYKETNGVGEFKLSLISLKQGRNLIIQFETTDTGKGKEIKNKFLKWAMNNFSDNWGQIGYHCFKELRGTVYVKSRKNEKHHIGTLRLQFIENDCCKKIFFDVKPIDRNLELDVRQFGLSEVTEWIDMGNGVYNITYTHSLRKKGTHTLSLHIQREEFSHEIMQVNEDFQWSHSPALSSREYEYFQMLHSLEQKTRLVEDTLLQLQRKQEAGTYLPACVWYVP